MTSEGPPTNSTAKTDRPSRFADLAVLTKARLSLLVVFTTAVGFCASSDGSAPWTDLLYAVLGTAAAAASASALNQWMESDVDQLMERTRERPLAAGRWRRSTGMLLGLLLGVAGLGLLWSTLPPGASLLALATILIYLLVYTPLKRRSAWCVLVGAVSGALPPVIGWYAAGAHETWMAWVLFGILFCWQMPHFLAIAWMYRDEYRSAGFVMIKADDDDGLVTASQSLVFAVLLSLVTMIPVFIGHATSVYRIVALILDLLFCGAAVVFLVERSRVSARRLFFMSIIYLPTILGLLALTRRL